MTETEGKEILNLVDTIKSEIRPSAIYAIDEMLKQLPSAEPEIIRCKDCVKCGFCGDETNLEIMGFNGFCSRAERRK